MKLAQYAVTALILMTVTMAFQNCSGFRATKGRQLDAQTKQELVKPMFHASPFGEYSPGTSTVDAASSSTEGEFTSTTEGTVTLINPDQPVLDDNVCQVHTPAFNGIRDAIKSKAAAADQSVTIGELNGCEAGLVKFSAAAYDANGVLVKAALSPSYQKARIGVYCPGYDELLGLLLRRFVASGFRGPKIKTTHICTSTTVPATCNPTSPGYIFGVEYGKYGHQFRISNIDGEKDAKLNVDSDDIVAKIYLTGGVTYSSLDVCNKVALWSPLIIEKKFGANIRTLNPATTQTLFDLSGTGVKNRISCVKDGAFLVLPDSNGNVVNINNLFGNNTVGPDGQKAANGFAALGKHDDKFQMDPDYGVITPLNRVWNRLRLWEDINCDGTAQQTEVFPLSAWGIQGIRWYDHIEMIDIDRYGNRTLQRNITYTNRGSGKLRVFDVWFRDFNQP
jgi:hypothetical protein